MNNIIIKKDAEKIVSASIEAMLQSKEEDIYPIAVISCRPNNKALPFFEKYGLGHKVYVFVNEDLVSTFKKNYPTVNVIAREKYKKPTDFRGIEYCPGGARILSFRGMITMGFKRFISCDDDLVALTPLAPIIATDNSYNKEGYKCKRITASYFEKFKMAQPFAALSLGCRTADLIFDKDPECVMGTPRYSGRYNVHDAMLAKAPGSLFVNSDFFYVDSERIGKILSAIDMSNPLDIELLKIYEDHLYMMLEYSQGKRHFVIQNIYKEKSTADKTANLGRTDQTLTALYPKMKADPRFTSLFKGEMIKIQQAKGKTLNKDWTYFTVRNSNTFYEKVLGKKVHTYDLTDFYLQYANGRQHDLTAALSTDTIKVTVAQESEKGDALKQGNLFGG